MICEEKKKVEEEEEEEIQPWFGMDEEAFDVTEATRKQTCCFLNGKKKLNTLASE